MSFDVRDQLRDVWRQLAELQRSAAYIPARLAETYPAGLAPGVADELIPPGASGSVNGGAASAVNATGHPIWAGSQIWLDENLQYVLGSQAATLLYGTWDGSGAKSNVESYSLAAADRLKYDDAGVVNAAFDIVDSAGLLSAVAADDAVIFATGKRDDPGAKPSALYAIGPSGTGGGGGGPPWTGWPGPDPTTGVAPLIVFLAKVNQSTVLGSNGTFDFDETTEIVGTAPASGTCANIFSRAFLDDERFLVFGDAQGNYYAVKTLTNIAWAQANVGTDGVSFSDNEFELASFEALSGPEPASGTCVNTPLLHAATVSPLRHNEYAHGEWLLVALRDDGKWIPCDSCRTILFQTTSEISARSEAGGVVTWGSGTANAYVKGSAATSSLNTDCTFTLYNSTRNTVGSGRIVQAKIIGGRWFVDVDDCNAEDV